MAIKQRWENNMASICFGIIKGSDGRVNKDTKVWTCCSKNNEATGLAGTSVGERSKSYSCFLSLSCQNGNEKFGS